MKTKTSPASLSTGIIWAEGKTAYSRNFRHNVRQDELDHFEWIRNDGVSFGIERLKDSKADALIEASFNIDSISSGWTQYFSVSKRNFKLPLPFIFYFGMECDTSKSSQPCFSVGSDVHSIRVFPAIRDGEDEDSPLQDSLVVGYSVLSGWFSLRLTIAENPEEVKVAGDIDNYPNNDRPTMSFWGVSGVNGMSVAVDEVRGSSEENTRRGREALRDKTSTSLEEAPPIVGSVFDIKTSALPNIVSDDAVGIMVQTLSKTSFEFTAMFRTNVQWMSMDDVLKDSNQFSPEFARVRHVDQIESRKQSFEDKFERAFELSTSSEFTEGDLETAKRCLSNLLGGLGYFHGRPVIGDSHTFADNQEQEGIVNPQTGLQNKVQSLPPPDVYLSLFSATPSRSSFPRGFLWDEGFHQMLVSQWNSFITMDVVKHWLGCMLHFAPREGVGENEQCVGGWMPRELILGEEATRAVPKEFVTQRVDIANPPTLLMAIESLMQRLKRLDTAECSGEGKSDILCASNASDREKEIHAIRDFLRDTVDPLHRWVQWMLQSQAGPTGWRLLNGKNVSTSGSFRWRGRRADRSRLLTNTLASGLDDYPRSAVASDDEFHVDLLCWIIKSIEIMKKIKDILIDGGNSHLLGREFDMYSNDVINTYIDNLFAWHWSDKVGAFVDVGQIGKSEKLTSDLTIRCRAGDKRRGFTDIQVREDVMMNAQHNPDTVCPPAFPKFVSPHGDANGNLLRKVVYETPGKLHLGHIPRVGYLSIFPLLLCILPANSPQLPKLLDVIESREHLWSDYGLRSISTLDLFYQKENAPGDAPYWR